MCTACWRGYWCEYNISEEGLFLQNLYIFNQDNQYPEINGVSVSPQTYHEATLYSFSDTEPKKVQTEDHMGHRVYSNINLRIPYTGRILVGDKFISKYYIHMGFQQGWAYEVLQEFIFKNGYLLEMIDYSEVAQKMRQQFEKNMINPSRSEARNILQFVDDSFSLDYLTKAWWIKT